MLLRSYSTIHTHTNLLTFEQMKDTILAIKAQGFCVGLCHGCFDVLHTGHLRHFESARSQCDVLMVSVTPDEFINKGAGRPVFPAAERAELIAGIGAVDFTVINQWPSAVNLLKELRPNAFFKGQEYESRAMQVNPNFIEEKDVAQSLGIDVRFTYEKVRSSSATLKVYENKKNSDN
jgi:cytidyltransferase-like protein